MKPLSAVLPAFLALLVVAPNCTTAQVPPKSGASTPTASGSVCGACTPCPAGEVCTNGTCVNPPPQCPAGTTECDVNGVSQGCFNLSSDPGHCGSCTVACPTGNSCTNGACVSPPPQCPAGTTECDLNGASQGCFNLSSDPGHCGSCTVACPAGDSCTNGGCVAPVAQFVAVRLVIITGGDDARSDTELTATIPGQPAMCLKPSNNAKPDSTCANGSSSHDQNGNQSWNNGTTSNQIFRLPNPTPATQLTSLTITLIEHPSGFEGADNWDLQGITVAGYDANGNSTTLLQMSNPPNGNNCMARLKGPPNPSSVTYNLSVANPGGSNLSNPTFGPTPPGSCPQ
jgi:hypothetical protein